MAAILVIVPWVMLVREMNRVRTLKRCWIKMSDFCITSLNDVANELSFSMGEDPTRHSYTLLERARLWGEVVDEHARVQLSAGIRKGTASDPYRT